MEKLSEEQRFKVCKMSDETLRKKLVQAGYKEVDIIGLDRHALLKYVAEVILAETAYMPEQIGVSSLQTMAAVMKMVRKNLLWEVWWILI